MLFFALLAAFLIEQLVPLAEGNAAHALAKRWVLLARSKVVATNSWQVWQVWLWWCAAVLLPVAASVLVYQVLLAIWLPLAWLWLVAVLYLTMGFRQFSHYFSRIRDALQEGRQDEALAALAQWRQVDGAEARRPDWVARVLSLALLAAQRHVLGVWLAFAVLGAFGLGPAGAVLYRMAEYVARLWRVQASDNDQPEELSNEQLEVATQRALVSAAAWHYVDWLPVRVSALGFAAAGNFEGVVGAWRDAQDSADNSNDSLLLAAGAGALNVSLQEDLEAQGSAPNTKASQAQALSEQLQAPEETIEGLTVMSATMLGENASRATQAPSQEGPIAPAKPRHVAALSGLVWRVVVLAMSVLAGLTLVSWVN